MPLGGCAILRLCKKEAATMILLPKSNIADAHSIKLSSRDSVLKVAGLNMNRVTNTNEIESALNMLAFSKHVPALLSGLAVPLLLIKLQNMAVIEIKIVTLRMIYSGEKFGGASVSMPAAQYHLSRLMTATSPVQPNRNATYPDAVKRLVFTISN